MILKDLQILEYDTLSVRTKSSTAGVTLISLVVTIIVLLILAGISISMLSGENSILSRATEAREKMEEANIKEQQMLEDFAGMMDGVAESSEGFNYTEKVNAPELKDGMIPITYDGSKWVVADKENTNRSWYDYDNKKWANICTVDSTNASLRTAEIGTEVPLADMTTMFVWIPRYAYSIVDGYQTSNTETPAETNASSNKKIDVKFLVGNTNRDVDNNTYNTDYNEATDVQNGKTPMIVHPGFKMGNKELRGIWVAKFEASGTDSNGNAVGNASSSSSIPVEPDGNTYVKSIPNVISWRHLTIGESQYRCMQMSTNTNAYGWNGVNSHLIRNSEWGAVAYLCYSKYGSVPMINGCGSRISGGYYYDCYTGMGPTSATSEERYEAISTNMIGQNRKYNENFGILASTTGNVFGIYDMSGGAWERVAAYLDNGNDNLNIYGVSSSNSSVKYFENGKLNLSYSNLWEKYEVGQEEKSNSIGIVGEMNLTQIALDEKEGSLYTDIEVNKKYNTARKRLTDETYNLMAKIKGIGLNETADSCSYFGVNKYGNRTWLISEMDTNTNRGKTWNKGIVIIGHNSWPFIVRGGDINNNYGPGILDFSHYGYAGHNDGFRTVVSP